MIARYLSVFCVKIIKKNIEVYNITEISEDIICNILFLFVEIKYIIKDNIRNTGTLNKNAVRNFLFNSMFFLIISFNMY